MSSVNTCLSSRVFGRLVRAARSGSNEALGELLDQWRDYLLLVANQELGRDLYSKAGASDVVQDAFTRAHRNFGSFKGGSEAQLVAWLRQILIHQIFELRNFSQRQKRDVRREEPLGNNEELQLMVASLPTENGCPVCHATEKEDLATISRALESLSAVQRDVIQLRYWENLSFPEIGQRIGRSAEAVRKCWFRAVQKLERSGACKNAEP